MKAKQILSIAIVSGVGFLGVNTGLGQDTSVDSVQAINSATQNLAEGNIDEALQGYDSAAEISADNYTLQYNRGIALYRQGKIEAAEQQFLAALDSTDADLAAKSWFNLGNCDYSTALEAAEQDRPAAIESLRGAISKYRHALKLASDDTDARVNIELAAKLMSQLQQQEEEEQQQNQEQQSQDQQQQDQSQQDQDQSGQQQNQDQQSQGQSGDEQQQDQSGENNSEGQQSENPSDSQAEQNENQSQSESQQDQSGEQGDQTEQQNQQEQQTGENQSEQNSDGTQQGEKDPANEQKANAEQ